MIGELCGKIGSLENFVTPGVFGPKAPPDVLDSACEIQWLSKKLVIWSIYLINLVFLTKVFEL